MPVVRRGVAMKRPVLVDDHGLAHSVMHVGMSFLLVRCFTGVLPWNGQALEYRAPTCLACVALLGRGERNE